MTAQFKPVRIVPNDDSMNGNSLIMFGKIDMAAVSGVNAGHLTFVLAAAPDMLEALKLILSPSPHYAATQSHRDLIAKAREMGLAAIAKAEGRS
jgi:hypothetical protein